MLNVDYDSSANLLAYFYYNFPTNYQHLMCKKSLCYTNNMKKNKLIVEINRPIDKVFKFTITPPNSSKWIPGVVKEETNEWPIRIGTVYKLTDKDGKSSEVVVKAIKENVMVEWITRDKNYHCRYTYKPVNEDLSKLEYFEWVDTGDIEEPFTQSTLESLKKALED